MVSAADDEYSEFAATVLQHGRYINHIVAPSTHGAKSGREFCRGVGSQPNTLPQPGEAGPQGPVIL